MPDVLLVNSVKCVEHLAQHVTCFFLCKGLTCTLNP